MSGTRLFVLVIVAGLLGGGATALALVALAPDVLRPEGVTGAAPETVVALQAEIAELTERLRALEDQPPVAVPVSGTSRSGPSPTSGASGIEVPPPPADTPSAESRSPGGGPSVLAPDGSPSPALQDALRDWLGNPDFRSAVEATVEEIERKKAEAKAAAEREKRREAFMKLVGARLAELREPLGLSDAQVEATEALATEMADKRLQAEAAGASGEELREIDREGQAGVRRIFGEQAYREYRKQELGQMARPIVGQIATNAGIDEDQRRQLDRLVEDHLERIVDDDVRVASEPLTPDERKAAKERMDQANQEAWQRIRDEIFTEEQRRRMPKPPGS